MSVATSEPSAAPAPVAAPPRLSALVVVRNEEVQLAECLSRLTFADELVIVLDRYTSLRAEDLRRSGDIGSYGHNLRRIVTRFWKCYISRRGYREGPYGFLIALCAALYPILSYLKARLEPD